MAPVVAAACPARGSGWSWRRPISDGSDDGSGDGSGGSYGEPVTLPLPLPMTTRGSFVTYRRMELATTAGTAYALLDGESYAIPDGHPNGRGNAFYAELLREHVLALERAVKGTP